MKNLENELKILELISQGKDNISQRDISRIIGMSLGMTNSILKRFAEKGLITIKKVNNRNIHYILTSDGMEEIGKRSWGYFKRTIKNVVVYREVLNKIIRKAIDNGSQRVFLVGKSDLDFIVEHECYKLNISYEAVVVGSEAHGEGSFYIFAETNNSDGFNSNEENTYSLNQLVLG